ncbi:MAG: amidohydrolase family protein [Acidimicrobiales bacterium]
MELGYRSVDADNHYYEPPDCFSRHIERDKAHLAFRLGEVDGAPCTVIDGKPVHTLIPTGFFLPGNIAQPGSLRQMMRNLKQGVSQAMLDETNPAVGPSQPSWFERGARLELMDAQGVEATLLFPSTGVTVEPAFEGDKTTICANFRAFNRWLAEDWGLGADGRLFGTPLISLVDADVAVAELEWALARGCRAVNLAAGPAYGRSPADPVFDPFWARMHEARVLCAIHVGDAGYNRREAAAWGEEARPATHSQSAFQWTHCFGDRPIMETISALIYGNLFGRFPNVKVVSVENGSLFVGYLLKLMDKMVGMGRGGPWPGGRLPARPSEIFREHVYVSPFHEEDIRGLVELIGADRVLFGSDYPHPEGLAEPNDFAQGLSGLSEGDVERIMRANLAELLGL